MNSRVILAALALACPVLTASPVGAAQACPTEHARYELTADPTFTAGFHRIGKIEGVLSDLGFFIHSSRTGRTYWFFFDWGTARYINLISTNDFTAPGWRPDIDDGRKRPPPGDMHLLQADNHYRFSLELPKHHARPPAVILIPDLRRAFADNGMHDEQPPLSFFRLTSCARAGDYAY